MLRNTCPRDSQYYVSSIKRNNLLIYQSFVSFVATDRRVEILEEGRSGHQGHRLARKNSYTTARSAGEVLFENNLLGGAALHQSRASRSCDRKMSGGSWCSLSSSQRFRHGWVSSLPFCRWNLRRSMKPGSLLSCTLNSSENTDTHAGIINFLPFKRLCVKLRFESFYTPDLTRRSVFIFVRSLGRQDAVGR